MPGEVARSWGKVLGQVAAAAILLGVFGTVAIVVPDHWSGGRRSPADSPGKLRPVGLPSPYLWR